MAFQNNVEGQEFCTASGEEAHPQGVSQSKPNEKQQGGPSSLDSQLDISRGLVGSWKFHLYQEVIRCASAILRCQWRLSGKPGLLATHSNTKATQTLPLPE